MINKSSRLRLLSNAIAYLLWPLRKDCLPNVVDTSHLCEDCSLFIVPCQLSLAFARQTMCPVTQFVTAMAIYAATSSLWPWTTFQ